ncbi:substrate-binding domain-containing protein [Burkholderia cenocepacia]|uniref:helix-turn-helix transcriptional regulator n=1 Tax=Burkholderia cenocepacia TaxID=95486 RepID=UPI0003C49A65|nr:substrate-binding domain-containing protein [Burkholderia cenocepacia]ESS39924.1 Periplasmic molybdate-binding domain protein [Burkholderia cenocepacia KC-01]MBR8305088.1 helix-turn-helix transcriptional regulator [Burkholderia cenocepacia]MCA7964273.1 helix-turn-helix transcriptional regulator [Burkholderia cenocepacia]MDR8026184.1 helix-turn-helix transcriptional regulator [Burkholderia cenocepacia]MDR8043424.1 helix-turn-helix transcriptional regulator [Burkholderia cenocepacia]
MIRIECDAYLTVRDTEGRSASLSDVAPLLELVAETGSIAQAAQAKGLSYRHAWGMLRALESCIGGELIETARGKGSTLSALGQAVVDAQRLARSRLDGNLRTLAAEVASELNRRLAQRDGAVRIHASHGYAVATLVSALVDAQAAVDIKYRESVEAVQALARGECDLAGFHLPRGAFRAQCAQIYRPWFDDTRHVLIHLTRRQQGLFVPRGNPKQVRGLADLARSDIRFVNRQPGSGTRMLLDLALRAIGIDPERIDGYASAELTHSAIAAFVASGMADLGFGVEPAARHFGLDFIPVVDEDYYFACERARLDVRPLADVLALLRDARFVERVAHLDGYDPAACGALEPIATGLAGSDGTSVPDRNSP